MVGNQDKVTSICALGHPDVRTSLTQHFIVESSESLTNWGALISLGNLTVQGLLRA